MITLRKVDDSNEQEIVQLCVREDQQEYVTSALDSMGEYRAITTAGDWAAPFGIYDGDLPVGFVLFTYEKSPSSNAPAVAAGNYDISHFYIDKRYQHRGYGREAIRLCIDYLRTFPGGIADYIWIAWNPANHVAEHLYASAGFRATDMKNYIETVGVLPIRDGVTAQNPAWELL